MDISEKIQKIQNFFEDLDYYFGEDSKFLKENRQDLLEIQIELLQGIRQIRGNLFQDIADEMQKLKIDLEKCQNDLNDTEEENYRLESEIDDLERANKLLQNEVEDLKDQLQLGD